MGRLLSMMQPMIISMLFSGILPLTQKSKFGLVLMALSGLLVFVAAGFFVYAAYLWLNTNYTPETAAAFTGVLVLFLSGCMALTAWGIQEYRQRKLNRLKNEIQDTLEGILQYINEELSEPIVEHPKTAASIASFAGYTLGKRLQ